ncbi:MAG: NAD-dependent epimerase/dehydratase family protein, partial [Elusimicrobiaceae bacterium]|nr:NAD-dependent epimerase/dehydratase family protein [Elusimicrobiaceae bacterium]
MSKTPLTLSNKSILITGTAGFIGAALANRVCQENPQATVIGLDSVNDYYDVSLKQYRLAQLAKLPNFTF